MLNVNELAGFGAALAVEPPEIVASFHRRANASSRELSLDIEGVLPGHLLLACCSKENSAGVVNAPSGFEQLVQFATPSSRRWFYGWKIADGGESRIQFSYSTGDGTQSRDMRLALFILKNASSAYTDGAFVGLSDGSGPAAIDPPALVAPWERGPNLFVPLLYQGAVGSEGSGYTSPPDGYQIFGSANAHFVAGMKVEQAAYEDPGPFPNTAGTSTTRTAVTIVIEPR